MRNFKDRISTIVDRKKITFEDNQEERFAIVEFADEPTELGTDINRTNMMGVQGYVNSDITFNPDGSITTIYPNNVIETTIFNDDGSIKQEYNLDGEIKNKFTYFDEDGSITETFTERPYIDKNTKLLLHGYNTIDNSFYKVPLINNGVIVSTSQSKFGESSLYFNGNASFEIENPTLIPQTGDFTIDWWEYKLSAPSNDGVFFYPLPNAEDTGLGLLIGLDQPPNVLLYLSTDGLDWNIFRGVNMGTLNLNQWTHRAIVRYKGNILIFENGIKISELLLDRLLEIKSGNVARIGTYTTTPMNGYIEEFRISNIARWTENFTPPTEPYDINQRP